GILGAFTGGEVTAFCIERLGVSTENLLFFCMGFLFISAVLSSAAWKKSSGQLSLSKKPRSRGKPRAEKMGHSVKAIFGSKHLKLTVGIIALTMMVATFVDYQFKSEAVNAFPTKPELTSFLGQFYGRLSLVSLGLQLLFAYRFIRWLGVGGIIMFLPMGLVLGSAGMFMFPGLLAAVLLRGADGSLKYSLDKTGRELLFLPIPSQLKARTKIFIDVFVDRWFRGLAGGLLLMFTAVWSLSVREISLVVLGLLAVWLVLVLMMRKEYVNSFRTALEKRHIDADDIRMNINDTATVNALIAGLGSTNDRQVVYSLRMVKSVTDVELVWPVLPLLRHRSAEVRRTALEALQIHGGTQQVEEVKRLLTDSDISVRCEAIHFLSQQESPDGIDTIRQYLGSTEIGIQHGALACMATYGTSETERLLTDRVISGIMQETSPGAVEGRAQLARALGTMQSTKTAEVLEQLLDDPSTTVIKHAIAGVGRRQIRSRVPWLLEHLADRELRSDSRAALAAFGRSILGTLHDYLMDTGIPLNIRRNIPRVMRQIPIQQTVEILTTVLGKVEPTINGAVIKALNSLRTRHSDLAFNSDELGESLVGQTKSYYQVARVLHLHQQSLDSPAGNLLQRALQEKQQQNLERIFRLLGLVYPPRDIYYAYLGIVSGRKMLHANAIEFLDNLLRTDIKRYILPILDDVSPGLILQKGSELFEVGYADREDALTYLMEGPDSWLRACAVFTIRPDDSHRLQELVEKSLDDPDPVVRETARLMKANKGP
ncbi:MAG: MFS transporter, partial [candidate division Zixibacteria bacterium]|nr:MFS transporter [candidate division Zixibacteria bacterium]